MFRDQLKEEDVFCDQVGFFSVHMDTEVVLFAVQVMGCWISKSFG